VSVQYWQIRARSDGHHFGLMCDFRIPVSNGAIPLML
jgi:hypothetical protein